MGTVGPPAPFDCCSSLLNLVAERGGRAAHGEVGVPGGRVQGGDVTRPAGEPRGCGFPAPRLKAGGWGRAGGFGAHPPVGTAWILGTGMGTCVRVSAPDTGARSRAGV